MYIVNNRKLKDKNEQIASQNKDLDKKNKDILDSIYYARKIQNALLVSNNCLADRFEDHLIFNRPRDIVSGDFSWCDASSNDCVIAVADCTGHGVPGAFMSVLAISSLDKIVKQVGTRDPKTILRQLNDDLYGLFGADSRKEGNSGQASVKDGMDIVVINVDTKNKKLGFAGSRNSLVKISGNEIVEIKGSKAHLGQNYGHDNFNNQEVQLQDGDALYLFSDGFYDQKGGEKGKKFYPKRFREMLLEHAAKDMKTQSNCYSEIFTEWSSGREQIDDILILGIRL
jgi:serine phosphatase RsbU (regulator of sigma subunit)